MSTNNNKFICVDCVASRRVSVSYEDPKSGDTVYELDAIEFLPNTPGMVVINTSNIVSIRPLTPYDIKGGSGISGEFLEFFENTYSVQDYSVIITYEEVYVSTEPIYSIIDKIRLANDTVITSYN